MQIVAYVVAILITWGISEIISDENMLSLLTHDITYIWLAFLVFSTVLFHISLSLVTYILLAKPDWKVAYLSPLFETGVLFILLLIIQILAEFGMKQ